MEHYWPWYKGINFFFQYHNLLSHHQNNLIKFRILSGQSIISTVLHHDLVLPVESEIRFCLYILGHSPMAQLKGR